MTLDVVFFELRGRRCALPVAAVREVMTAPNMTPVPLTPPAVRGVAPIHGKVIPVLDLGVLLTSSGDGRPDVFGYRAAADRVLVVEATSTADSAPMQAALLVDRVMRLGTVDEDHCRPPPPGPSFVSATVLDLEGPALLIDANRAMDQIRDAIITSTTVRS